MRNEMGHRYYTEQDIRKLQEIKQLKEQGLQLKAIRTILFRFFDIFFLLWYFLYLCRFANLVKSGSHTSSTVPMGPFLCFAMMAGDLGYLPLPQGAGQRAACAGDRFIAAEPCGGAETGSQADAVRPA